MSILSYILIALVFSTFFSGMEIAFVSSNKLLHELDKKKKDLSSKILDIFFRNPNQFISTMLVGYNISLVAYGLLAAVLLNPYITYYINNNVAIIIIQSVISAIFIIFMGVFIPKTIFKLNSNFSLNFFALPSFLFYIILYPVSKLTSMLSHGILKIFGVKNINDTSSKALSKIDLDYFIQQSIEEGQQHSDMEMEVKMLQNALDFSNIRLRDCIVPRTEIVACDTKTTIKELKSKFVETGLSKIVVFNENIDDVIGYIHSSELFKNPTDWTQYIQTVPIVPETMAANKLMKLLMQDKKSLAVVVDEFGGTSGIVTLEDLVEEIFGEIEDEHDTKIHMAKKISENEYLLSGRIEIDALNEEFELDLPESDDYVTVAGYILHFHQKFPKLNESIVIDKYTFKIIKVTATKIELVRMKVST